MQKLKRYIRVTLYIAMSTTAACNQNSHTYSISIEDTIAKTNPVSKKWKDSSVQKADTGTALLLDTIIARRDIVISRRTDTFQDYMNFSISGKMLRIPQGAHQGANLYPGIVNIDDPTLVSNKVYCRDGLLMAAFDRIFAQGELYAIRSTKDSLEALNSGDMESIISYNGAFFFDPVRNHLICFTPVDPEKKLVSMAVFSIGHRNFKYIGSYEVNTEEFYEPKKSVVIKSYLKWENKGGVN